MLALALLAGGMQASFRTEELVTRTGLCRLTLRRALRALHAKGLITIKEVRSGTGGLTTVKLSSAWIEVKP